MSPSQHRSDLGTEEIGGTPNLDLSIADHQEKGDWNTTMITSLKGVHAVLSVLEDTDMHIPNIDGVTALHITRDEGREECAEIHIAAKAKLDSTDSTGVS